MHSIIVTFSADEKGRMEFGISDVCELLLPPKAVAEHEADIARQLCGHLKHHIRRLSEAIQTNLDVSAAVREGNPVADNNPPERSMFTEDNETNGEGI